MDSHTHSYRALPDLFEGPPAIINPTPHPAITAALRLAEDARRCGRLEPLSTRRARLLARTGSPACYFHLYRIAQDMAHVHNGEVAEIFAILQARYPGFS